MTKSIVERLIPIQEKYNKIMRDLNQLLYDRDPELANEIITNYLETGNMENLTELNTKSFTKKKQYYLEKEFPFDENNKEVIRDIANKFSFNKSIVERDRKYHLEETKNSFKVNYRNKKAEMLR